MLSDDREIVIASFAVALSDVYHMDGRLLSLFIDNFRLYVADMEQNEIDDLQNFSKAYISLGSGGLAPSN